LRRFDDKLLLLLFLKDILALGVRASMADELVTALLDPSHDMRTLIDEHRVDDV